MMGPNRVLSLLQPVVLLLVVLFVIVNIYGYITSDDYDDDTVTVTFNCTQVLGNENNFPDFVVQQCKQLRIR